VETVQSWRADDLWITKCCHQAGVLLNKERWQFHKWGFSTINSGLQGTQQRKTGSGRALTFWMSPVQTVSGTPPAHAYNLPSPWAYHLSFLKEYQHQWAHSFGHTTPDSYRKFTKATMHTFLHGSTPWKMHLQMTDLSAPSSWPPHKQPIESIWF
jgi:hypothetical protein